MFRGLSSRGVGITEHELITTGVNPPSAEKSVAVKGEEETGGRRTDGEGVGDDAASETTLPREDALTTH